MIDDLKFPFSSSFYLFFCLSDSKLIAEKLYWGENIDNFIEKYPNKFDVVIAADVIYEEGQVDPLIETVVQILKGRERGSDRDRYEGREKVKEIEGVKKRDKRKTIEREREEYMYLYMNIYM